MAYLHPLMHYGSSGVVRIRSQLALAHDAALVRLIDALYLIFKLAIARRQSLDHNVCFVRDVQANRVRGKQPLADLESVMRHNANAFAYCAGRADLSRRLGGPKNVKEPSWGGGSFFIR
jgi:hypothetical protein